MKNYLVFNKLVRDKIPDKIISNGEYSETRTLSKEEYKDKLLEKLQEEYFELLKATNKAEQLEEITDIKEVLIAIIDILGLTENEVEEARIAKREEKGSFSKRILLISTSGEKKC